MAGRKAPRRVTEADERDKALRDWLQPVSECHLMSSIDFMPYIDGATAEEAALEAWAEEHYAKQLATYRGSDCERVGWHGPSTPQDTAR